MKDVLAYIADNWVLIVALIGLGIASMYVPIIRGAVMRIWAAVMSERVIARFIIFLLKSIVSSTKNKVDDKLVQQIEDAMGFHHKKDTKETP